MAKSRKEQMAIAEWERFSQTIRDRYTSDSVEEILRLIAGKKVLVIGETIIDEYAYVESMSKSPKGNLIATRFLRREYFAGGILACANHVAGFCPQTALVTCLGQKRPMRGLILKRLKPEIAAEFFVRKDAPTTLNSRFIDMVGGANHKLLGVYYFEHRPIAKELEEKILDFLGRVIDGIDVVLAVDYGHGFFTEKIIRLICEKARFLALNVQTNSTNFGFNSIHKFPSADYVCLDDLEARLAEDSRFGSLQNIIQRIAARTACQLASITLGKNGAILFSAKNGLLKVPAQPAQVVDAVGTGDAYLSVTAPCVAAGAPMDLTGFIGSIVGSLHSQTLCNRQTVDRAMLEKALQEMWS